MQFLNEMLSNALVTVLLQKEKELFNNVNFSIKYEDLEKIIKEKSFYLLSRIVDILGEDMEDFDAVEKIVKLFEENNLDCGGRHDF